LVVGGKDCPQVFRIGVVETGREIDEVDEQDRHHFALLGLRPLLLLQRSGAGTAELETVRVALAAVGADRHD
jgi:hypothetical protein